MLMVSYNNSGFGGAIEVCVQIYTKVLKAKRDALKAGDGYVSHALAFKLLKRIKIYDLFIIA
ncbi:MAG: hypothetical protein FD159_2561 [Syntrophaceae bacterium]|nr:MAG: hypothetical protein FD159_2561 [Syntrophaceae bacterium]